MRYNCRCTPELNQFERQLITAAFYSAVFTECLVFHKKEWVEDCGFIISDKLVDLPRRFDGKSAKIRCFTECLELLGSDWTNELAEKNHDMMVQYLQEHTAGV